MINDKFSGLTNLFNGYARSRETAYSQSSGVVSGGGGVIAGPAIPSIINVLPNGSPNYATSQNVGLARLNLSNVFGSFRRN